LYVSLDNFISALLAFFVSGLVLISSQEIGWEEMVYSVSSET